MSKFLDDLELGPAITDLMQGSTSRCAVAFWGDGASGALFPHDHLPSDVRIVCDITMGGSNPRELRVLGAPDNNMIRHLRGLHAKVYLSDKGLITSSANASNNGIGFLAGASLVEAGTFHKPGTEAYTSASRWFEKIWNSAAVVDEPALARAQKAWDRRPRGVGLFDDGHPANPASLFDVVAHDQSRFRGVGFAFTTENSTVRQRDEAAAAVIEKDQKQIVPLLSKSDRKAVRAWPVGDVFSNWEPEDIDAWPRRFVCAHQSTGGFSYYFYERIHTVVLESGRGMVLARRPGTLRKELGFERSAAAMASIDAPRASLIFKRIAVSGRRLYESGEKLAQLLTDMP